jgi:DNA-binding response OmpR family regulator
VGTADTPSVLLVDDGEVVLETLEQRLRPHGLTLLHAPDKRAGLQCFYATRPAAVVINCEAPGMPPFRLLERLRTLSDVPVVIMGPPSQHALTIRAFDAGADDFVPKPVDAEELAVRIRAILRRVRSGTHGAAYVDEHLEINFESHEVRTPAGDRIDLTPLQFRLLASLVRNRNRVLTPQQLLDLAWGPSADSVERVKVQVSNVRDRLACAGVSKQIVETVKGVGYRYRAR